MKNAVKATVAYQGKMLVIMHNDSSGVWAGVPGGGIEENESPLEAMCRELAEEICMIPSQLMPLEITHNENGTWCQRYFASLTDEEAAALSLGDEGFELRWCTFDEMLTLQLSPMGRTYYESDSGQDLRRRIEKTATVK